MQTFPIAKFVL